MSGMMNRDEQYQRMVERIRLGQRRDGTSSNGTRELNGSLLLPTTQTYMGAPSLAPSTSFAPSETSEFRMPGLPVSQSQGSSAWTMYSTRIRRIIKLLKNMQNRSTVQLVCRTIEEILDIDENSQPPIDHPGLLWDTVCQIVKEKYYNSTTPSSTMSMSSSTLGERTTDFARGPSSVLSATTAVEDPVPWMMPRGPSSVLSATTAVKDHPAPRMMQRRVALPQPDHYEQLMAELEKKELRRREERGGGGMARFDEYAPKARPGAPPSALPLDTPKTRANRNRKHALAARPDAYLKPQETPMVNGRSEQEERYTVTRSGRIVKTPTLFWTGNASCMDNSSSRPTGKKNLSNNNKSQAAKKTVKAIPIKKAAKNGTPPCTIMGNTNIRPKPRQKQNNSKAVSGEESNKENVKKSNKKNTSKDSSKVNGSNVGRKRKSLCAVQEPAKKKKFESPRLLEAREDADESDDSDDDLFSAVRRPKGIVSSQVVSPNAAGIRSAKKVLAGAVSKETPPCKAVGQMLDVSRISEARSSTATAPREPPKPKLTQVNKRVAKNIEKSLKDDKLKLSSDKEAPQRKKIIPLGTHTELGATYTMFLGEAIEASLDEEFNDSVVLEDEDNDLE